MKSLCAIAAGASVGAWLRWWLALAFNQIGIIPLGTLLANALGGLLMGVALAVLQLMPQLSPEWRLLLTTGFLGGLTTFSTFSAEAFALLQRQAYGWACLHMGVHVLISVLLTAAGYWLVMRGHG